MVNTPKVVEVKEGQDLDNKKTKSQKRVGFEEVEREEIVEEFEIPKAQKARLDPAQAN